ncbi:MAG TPA: hypothetical protein VKA32_02225, partial [Gammaproteobacteria bacterium]|nr:hypothetical protein [Gammaproteobacteria bacterium]
MRLRATLLPLLLTLAPAASPASPASPATDLNLDLSLDVSHDMTAVRYDDGREVDTQYTEVGASIWQTELSWLQMGLTGGVGWLSQNGDPVTEGRSFDMNYGGLMVRSRLPLAAGMGVSARAHWIYHQAKDNSDPQITLAWYDSEGRMGVYATFSELRLEGGGTVRHVDGERRRSGETLDFGAPQTTGAYLDADLLLQHSSRIGFHAEAGARKAFSIDF